MDDPTTLLPTRDGGLWAAGSDGKVAAVARFDGATWHLESHPELDSAVFAESGLSGSGRCTLVRVAAWQRTEGHRGNDAL